MEGSRPALPAEPGTLKATLPETPMIGQITERESAHPAYQQQGEQVALTNGMATIALNTPTIDKVANSGEEVISKDGDEKSDEGAGFSKRAVATVCYVEFVSLINN